MAQNMLRVGVITTTHGIRGEVKVYPTTDNPERFRDLDAVYISKNGKQELFHIETARFFKNQVILKFREINDINDVEKYRKADLLIDRTDAEELSEDEFFIDDLIGLSVVTEDGRKLGTLSKVYETGANDVYAVKNPSRHEILLPATKECIRSVDPENGQMIVHLLPGLEDLNG